MILQNRIKQSEFVRTVWSAQPEPGTKLEEMLKPEYWAHVARTMKPNDRIEVISAGGEWFAELYVRSIDGPGATVAVLRSHVFADSEATDNDSIEVKNRGGAGWSVIRKSDKAVLFEGGTTRKQAEDFVKAHNLA